MALLTQAAVMTLISQCSPQVAPDTMRNLIGVESHFNPYAIAIVRGAKGWKNQPKTKEEAIKRINYLNSVGANYSVGLAQINVVNFKPNKVTAIDLFEPCTNLRVSQNVLIGCYNKYYDLNKTLSCYYSGGSRYGFKIEKNTKTSYVHRIHNYVVPSLKTSPYHDKNRDFYQSSNGNNNLQKTAFKQQKKRVVVSRSGKLIKNSSLIFRKKETDL